MQLGNCVHYLLRIPFAAQDVFGYLIAGREQQGVIDGDVVEVLDHAHRFRKGSIVGRLLQEGRIGQYRFVGRIATHSAPFLLNLIGTKPLDEVEGRLLAIFVDVADDADALAA